MGRRAGVQGAGVEAGFEGFQPGQRAYTAVDEADVVLENGVGVSAVAKVDGNVRERRSDQGVHLGVGHEGQHVFRRAENQGVQAVIERNGLVSDQATAIEQASRVVSGRSRWPQSSFGRRPESERLW